MARPPRGRAAPLLIAVLLAGLSVCAAPQPARALELVLTAPAVADGDTLVHLGPTLPIRGELRGVCDGLELVANGQPATLGARDLAVEAIEAGAVPFSALIRLDPGLNPVQIVARCPGGAAATLRFSVRVPYAAAGTAYALIIGINDYRDERIPDLRFAEADAAAVRDALTDSSRGIVRPENALLLLGGEATYRNIAVAVEEQLVRQANSVDDIAFFYFAGHGAEGPHVSRGAAYYLVPHDADVRNLLSTGIEKGRLQFLWGAVGAARKVFITDACHSGRMEDMRVLTAQGFEAVEGFVTLAAARADQLSWELPRLGHGIFTHALTEALAGDADRQGGDADGFVSAAELGRYLRQRVPALAAEIGAEQAPVVDLVPGAESVLVATSARLPLPPWHRPAVTVPVSAVDSLSVTLLFGQRSRKPRMLIALRDEGGDPSLEAIGATAVVNRFLAASDRFLFVDPAVLSQALPGLQAELAFSSHPGDLAAVARAARADLILSGALRSEASGAAAQELLGTAVTSYQAHLSARVVYANGGEILQAANVQRPGMHLNGEMARRQAVEQAGAALADEVMAPLLERWSQMRRQRPDGTMSVSGVRDPATLAALVRALASLEPMVGEPEWRSFDQGTAVYELQTGAGPVEVASSLSSAGLPGFRIEDVRTAAGRLSFVATRTGEGRPE